MKLVKGHMRCDMRKLFFSGRIINVWNSLPTNIVNACTVNEFENKIDAQWSEQEMMHDYRAEIMGTGYSSCKLSDIDMGIETLPEPINCTLDYITYITDAWVYDSITAGDVVSVSVANVARPSVHCHACASLILFFTVTRVQL